MKTYGATKGAPFPKSKAQAYGRVIEKIEQTNGEVAPEKVVEEARNPSCPLHEYFDWNNTTAAKKYRLYQARNLINHLTVIVNYENGEEQKAFFSVKTKIPNDGVRVSYVNVEKALTDREFRKQVLQNALDEIIYWKDKYKKYSEFKGIIKAINWTIKKIKKKK